MDYCIYCMTRLDESGVCPKCGKSQSDYTPAIHHLLPGKIVNGKYLVGKVIGEGGFGITYVGRDITLDMKIAIKEYFPNGAVNRNNTYSEEVTTLAGDAEKYYEKGKTNFLTEARTLAKFSSDANCVSVRDFFEENNTAYIVMEYLEGRDLKTYLDEKGKLNFEETYKMLLPVMKVLEKVHNQGLIHRDISPANIMLVANYDAKLLDFGAARDYSQDEKSLSIMLKPGYAPEEQYRTKGKQGPWTDIYALSATIYKLLTGVTPEDSMNRIFSDEVQSIHELNPTVTPEQEAVVMKGMSVKSEDRYQNMAEMIKAYEDCFNKTNNTIAATANTNDSERTVAAVSTPNYSNIVNANSAASNEPNAPKSKKRVIIPVACVAAVLLVAGIAIAAGSNSSRSGHSGSSTTSAGSNSSRSGRSGSSTTSASETSSVSPSELMTAESIVITSKNKGYLSDLSNNTNLTTLVVNDGSNLTDSDISLIAKIPYLKKLTITGNTDVTSVLALQNMKSLTHLTLKDMTGLEESDFQKDLKVTSFPTIANLQYLEISNCNICDISPIKDMTSLRTLILSGNKITDISALSSLSFDDMDKVDLSNNEIIDISAFSGTKGPITLNIGFNRIQDISPLADHSKLSILDISHNRISDISPLHECFNIVNLDISFNEISDLSVLEYIDELQSISLRYNKITSLAELAKCKNLTENVGFLDASYNLITNTKGIESLKALQTLVLSHNKISDISTLKKCTLLTKLVLDDNLLNDESLENLLPMEKLNYLKIVGNRFKTVSVLSENKIGSGQLDIELTYGEDIDFAKLISQYRRFYVTVIDVSSDRQKAYLEDAGVGRFKTSDEYYKEAKEELQGFGITFKLVNDPSDAQKETKDKPE